MDKKFKIAIVIVFIVFAIGITIDANNKMKAIKERGNTEQQQVQPQNEQPASQTRNNPTEYGPYTGQQNPQIGPDGVPIMPIDEQSSEYSQTQESQHNRQEQSNITKIDNSLIKIDALGIEKPFSAINPSYVVTDALKNQYYFIIPGEDNNFSPSSMGLLVKLSPEKKVLWQQEIKSISARPFAFKRLSILNTSIKLIITTPHGAERYIGISTSGTVTFNPSKTYYTPTMTKSTASYNINIVKRFTSEEMEFAIVSYMDKKKSVSTNSLSEDFYVYKINPSKLTNVSFLFSRKLPISEANDLKEPEFKIEETGDPIFITAQSRGATAYANTVNIPKSVLKASEIIKTATSAPLEIQPGILIVPTAYNIEINKSSSKSDLTTAY